jgi:hypothetical protein
MIGMLRGQVLVTVITAHIAEQAKQVVEGIPVIDLAGLPDAVRRPFAQLRQASLRGGNANHRHVETTVPGHRVERRKKIILWARSPVTPKITSVSAVAMRFRV